MTEGVRPTSWTVAPTPGASVTTALYGNDTFLGGPGADVGRRRTGNDVGRPRRRAPTCPRRRGERHRLGARRVGDVVDCGAGTDTVTADRADVLSSCETVSLPAPETGKIDGPKKVTKGTKAFFTFGAPVAGATFECQVDTGAYKPCSSPFKVKTKKLKTGKHTLTVRAVQPAGNADPTPSTFKFKVTRRSSDQA